MNKITSEEYSKIMAAVARKSNYDITKSLDYIYHLDVALTQLNLDLTRALRLLNKAENPDHLGRLVKDTAGKRIYKKVYNENANDVEVAINDFKQNYRRYLSKETFEDALSTMSNAKKASDIRNIASIYTNLNFYRFKDTNEIVGHSGVTPAKTRSGKDSRTKVIYTQGNRKYNSERERNADEIYFDKELAKPYLNKVLNESTNPLEDANKEHKKRQKGTSPFVKLDAGDVEHNTEFFNNAMGSNCEGGACMESLQQSDKEEIEEIAKGDFESGHIFAEDYEEFKSQLRGEDIKVTEELYNYYKELKDLGPTGFYQEFKNKFTFDPDFVAEFGDDEDEEPIEESIEDIEKEEKKIAPQTINIRQALNDIDNNSINSDFVNMYDAANLTKEDKQKLALMLAGQSDVNEIYDFLATKCGEEYLHSESHLVEDIDEGDRYEPTLQDIVDEFMVVGPTYRGAPYPPYVADAINERNIPDCMRMKWYDIEVVSDDTIQLDYTTQEEFTSVDSEKFIEEAKNAFENLAYSIGYANAFTVALDVTCRDGAEYGKLVYDLEIGV